MSTKLDNEDEWWWVINNNKTKTISFRIYSNFIPQSITSASSQTTNISVIKSDKEGNSISSLKLPCTKFCHQAFMSFLLISTQRPFRWSSLASAHRRNSQDNRKWQENVVNLKKYDHILFIYSTRPSPHQNQNLAFSLKPNLQLCVVRLVFIIIIITIIIANQEEGRLRRR